MPSGPIASKYGVGLDASTGKPPLRQRASVTKYEVAFRMTD
jgi:hypothetical protein